MGNSHGAKHIFRFPVFTPGQIKTHANNRVGGGGEYQATDKLSLKGELSAGDLGMGAKFGADYKLSDDSNLYSSYTLDNERDVTGLRAMKDGNRRHRPVCFIGGEKFQLVAPIRNGREKILHPLAVSFQGGYFGQGACLRGKSRVGITECFAGIPSLSGFTRFKELPCRFENDTH